MHSLSITHQAFDRGLELASHLAGAAVAVGRRSIARARTESVLRTLCDAQFEDAGLQRPARRPQSAADARMMSDLMSMR